VIDYQCLEVGVNGLPSNIPRNGVWVTNTDGNEGAWLMGVSRGVMPIQLPWNGAVRQENEHLSEFVVSPDRIRLMYVHSNRTNTTDRQAGLVIVTSDGEEIWSQPIAPGEAWNWFDNERLSSWVSQEGGTPNLILLNYASGERQEIQADYPGYADVFSGLFLLKWNYPFTKYDLTLSRVVYPACDPDCMNGYPVILRDVETGQTLASFLTQDMFGLSPIWLPDFNQFIMAANLGSTDSYAKANEIYLISRDGEIRQLTRFTDYYSQVEIHPYYSLSPNGRYLAFWIKTQPGQFDDNRLAVLDIETGKVTNYCLPGEIFQNNLALESEGYPSNEGEAPVWSPDSTQMMVVGRDPEARGIRWNILVDIVYGTAIKVGEDMEIVGWMVSP
jgi:hypothetical protein